MKRGSLLIVMMMALMALALPTAVSASSADEGSKPFRMGVYMYEGHMARAATSYEREYYDYLEEHLAILQQHGVNAIYLGGTRRDGFDRMLALCDKYDISLIPQLDFAYFRNDWKEEDLIRNAKAAGQFIARYQDHPRVLAWSVREELPAAHIHTLARYYAMILEYAPRAKFNMIHSSLGAAQGQPVPDPIIFGTDRYAFWWEFSGGGYRASPSFALDWSRNQAAAYYEEAARRGADYMFVITQGGLLTPRSANRLLTQDDPARAQVRQRAQQYARDNRMGWRTFPGKDGQPDAYNVWKYYRLPTNCMRALAWTSVLEGARLFFCWSYTPVDANRAKATLEDIARQTERSEWAWVTLAGRPGQPNDLLAEFADAGREIRAYEGVITRMSKTPQSPLAIDHKGVHHRGFSLPSVVGRLAVIHNANVGSWPHDSRHFFHESDQIFIDDEGHFVDYKPFTEPLEVRFTLAGDVPADSRVYDLHTGESLKAGSEGAYVLPVGPGSGRLVYVGTPEGWQQVRGYLHSQTEGR